MAVRQFVEDVRSGRQFRKGLRVKGIQGASGSFEMSWADDGRATFEDGDEVVDGQLPARGRGAVQVGMTPC